MRITLKLLEEWNACEPALEWFAKDWPDGAEDTVEGLLYRVIPEGHEYWQLWLLHEIAKREEGKEGDTALSLLVEKADPSRLAKAVNEIKIRSVQEAFDALCNTGDVACLKEVAERAESKYVDDAVRKIAEVATEDQKAEVAKALPNERASLLERRGK